MSTAPRPAFSCPFCGTETAYEAMFSHGEDHAAFDALVCLMLPGLGTQVLRYVAMHAPAKNRLSMPRKQKLVMELLPDLQRGAISHKGREWQAPEAAWSRAIDQMLATCRRGELALPLQGHGYLYAVLAGQADKAEAAAEKATEQQRRQAGRRDTVLVDGVPTTLGDALEQIHGGRDPELVKAEQANRNASPVPAGVRERLSQLKKGG